MASRIASLTVSFGAIAAIFAYLTADQIRISVSIDVSGGKKFRGLLNLISEFLRDHEAPHTAVHDADAEAAELRAQNVGAVTR